MIKLIIRVLGNGLALYVAMLWVPGFSVTGGWQQFLIAAVVLSLLNMIVRPVLKLISFPLIMLTLGLFTIVINALMLWLLDYFLVSVSIVDFMALIWTMIVVSIVNLIVSMFTRLD